MLTLLPTHQVKFMKKIISVLISASLALSCFMPWVIIESKNIMVSGVDATGTNFGKPGYFHFAMIFLFLLFSFIPKLWMKRFNVFVTGLNFGWAIRNFIIISACSGGDCPEKQIGIYIMLFTSILLMIVSFFPEIPSNASESD